MSCTGFRSGLRPLLRDIPQNIEISGFLLPALSRPKSRRPFTTTKSQSSRIGSAQISIPPEVTLQFYDLPKSKNRSRKADAATAAVDIKGPLGQMTLPLPPYVVTDHDTESGKLSIRVQDAEIKHQHAMWGTMRALMQSHISGVSEGHICILRMVGVGYRATIENSATTKKPEYPGQQFVSLKLGYAHPIEMPIPMGVKATTPQPTRILLEGCDKQVVTQFAAEIRQWRKPEPYKGKGIYVNDETIRLKAKKIK